MKKYLILLILSVFMGFLVSSCMAGMSRDGSYGGDVSYRSGYDQGNHRGNHFRNRRDRNYHEDHRDRDDNNVLIIR